MGAKARAGWVFALAAATGLAGHTLLLAERQCSRLEEALREDFRVVLFLRAPVEEGRVKVLEERLRAQAEVLDARYVSADEALAALKRDDPELAESVALVGDNPLPAAFEVKPAPEALTRLGAWIDGVQRLAEWSDLRYKSGQLQAVLRLRFYVRLLRATLSALLCLAAILALTALAAAVRGRPAGPRLAAWALAAWALAGGVCGAALSVLIAWPLRRDDWLWAWPAASGQLALLASCAALGWSLSLWRSES